MLLLYTELNLQYQDSSSKDILDLTIDCREEFMRAITNSDLKNLRFPNCHNLLFPAILPVLTSLQRPKQFKADKPFIGIIVEKSTNVVLFSSVVVKPQGKHDLVNVNVKNPPLYDARN